MKEFLLLGIFWSLTLVQGHGEVKDYDRACPDGYLYTGEVDVYNEVTKGEHWLQGDSTPVYSCYQVHYGDRDWVQGSQKCSDNDGDLLSVNNFQEDRILTGDLFTSRIFQDTGLPLGPVLTSGVSLKPDNWTWFGAGESMSVDQTSQMNNLQTENSNGTLCVFLTWVQTTNVTTELVYNVMPCIGQYSVTICEVRAYTQTWYVWFTINWLQVLFLFTLVLLIISSCVTMQVWVSRPNRNVTRGRVPRSSPPPYTPTAETMTTPTSTTKTDLANKYAEKGKELLGKVVFYRKPEDKEQLTPSA